jgi:hypothetical protein
MMTHLLDMGAANEMLFISLKSREYLLKIFWGKGKKRFHFMYRILKDFILRNPTKYAQLTAPSENGKAFTLSHPDNRRRQSY